MIDTKKLREQADALASVSYVHIPATLQLVADEVDELKAQHAEMLAALKAMRDYATGNVKVNPRVARAVALKLADAAIARAEGR